MSTPGAPRWLRALISVLPQQFRSQFGADLAAMIRTNIDEARQRRGRVAAFLCGIRETASLLQLIWREHARQHGAWTPIDLRGSWRYLARNRTPTFTVILTLTAALTAVLTTFGMARAVLWQPLPFVESDRLVFAWEQADREGVLTPTRVTSGRFTYWREHQPVFNGVAAFGASTLTLDSAEGRRAVRGLRVTANYFDVLGFRPLLGRTFRANEDLPGADRVIVLSHALWSARFGGRPDVVGTRVPFDDTSYLVVGVMPPVVSPGWPSNPAVVSLSAEQRQFWVPLTRTPQFAASTRAHVLGVIGRLATGRTINDAMAALAETAEAPGGDRDRGTLTPFRAQFVTNAREPLLVLLGAALAVLLVAATNLAGLQASAFARRRAEFSMRAALGAGTSRLAQQLIIEALLLTAAAGTAAVLITRIFLRWLPAQLPPSVPLLTVPAIDAPVGAAAFALVALTAAILSAWPVSRLLTSSPAPRGVAPRSRASVYRLLVISQIAVTMGLVSAGALLVESLRRVYAQDPGFVVQNTVVADLALPSGLSTPDQIGGGVNAIVEAAGQITGVAAATAAYDLPLEANWTDPVAIVGDSSPQAERAVELRIVHPSYFRTMGTEIIDGRALAPTDQWSSAGAVVINESLARELGSHAIGKHLTSGAASYGSASGEPREFEIVGIAEDERFRGLEAPSRPAIYLSTSQFPQSTVSLLLRTDRPAAAIAAPLREAVRRVRPGSTLEAITSLDRVLADQLSPRRTTTKMVSTFALGALALAALGLYSLMAISVDERRRELGVRIALGASPSSLAVDVIGRAMRWTGAGLALGLVLSIASGRFVSSLLVGVSAADPATLVAVATIFIVVATAATLAPAVRASRVDAVQSLRGE